VYISTLRAAGEKKLGIFVSEKVPVIHISSILYAEHEKKLRCFVFVSKRCLLYTFLEFTFFRKNAKKNNIRRAFGRILSSSFVQIFLSQQPGLRSDYYSADLQITTPAFGRNVQKMNGDKKKKNLANATSTSENKQKFSKEKQNQTYKIVQKSKTPSKQP
jgi:hypothetical protein